MGRQKYFHCVKCNKKHQRPVGKNCTVEMVPEEKFSDLDSSVSSSTSTDDSTCGASGKSQDTNSLLLQEMKSLNSKMNLMEKRLATTEKQLKASTSAYGNRMAEVKKVRKKYLLYLNPRRLKRTHQMLSWSCLLRNSSRKIQRFDTKSRQGWKS